jgi:Fe-S cluster assembly ATPase SufC
MISRRNMSAQQDGLGASKVDVSRDEIAQALIIAATVVVIDEYVDLGLDVAGQIIVLKQHAVLERLMPALDLALRLPVAGAPCT